MRQDKLRMDVADGSQPSETVIVLEGFLNAETAFRLRDLVTDRVHANLVLDMSAVRSMDSSGLGVLIGLYVSFEPACRRLLLAGVNDRIWDLFRMCKIEDIFTRYATVADAERALAMVASVEPAASV